MKRLALSGLFTAAALVGTATLLAVKSGELERANETIARMCMATDDFTDIHNPNLTDVCLAQQKGWDKLRAEYDKENPDEHRMEQ